MNLPTAAAASPPRGVGCKAKKQQPPRSDHSHGRERTQVIRRPGVPLDELRRHLWRLDFIPLTRASHQSVSMLAEYLDAPDEQAWQVSAEIIAKTAAYQEAALHSSMGTNGS